MSCIRLGGGEMVHFSKRVTQERPLLVQTANVTRLLADAHVLRAKSTRSLSRQQTVKARAEVRAFQRVVIG